uniref:Uncharacterized protein n=1 Tax=Rhabditophanes sp. KR3021 TaxID=114890 RepID=A0AC35TKQ6_9BILA
MNFRTIAAFIAFFIASASAQYYSPYAGYAGSAYAGYLGAGYAGYYPGAYSGYYAGAFASPYFGYGSNQAQNKVANAPSNLKLTNNIA